MAISSYGYEGSITEREFAIASGFFGSDYGVSGASDFKVSIQATGDRLVSIAAGTAYGRGVLDISNSAVTVQLDGIASGSRWDAIVIRRDWTPVVGGLTSVTKVTGSSQQVVPGNLNRDPGVRDDQVLALVQVTAGNTTPTAIIDLRMFAAKAALMTDLRAWPDAPLGALATVDGITYRREMGSNGLATWSHTTSKTWRGQVWQGSPIAFPKDRLIVPPIYTATGRYARATNMVPQPSHSAYGKRFSFPFPGTYSIDWQPCWVGADGKSGAGMTGDAYALVILNMSDTNEWDAGSYYSSDGEVVGEDHRPISAGAPRATTTIEVKSTDTVMFATWHFSTSAPRLTFDQNSSWCQITRVS